MKDKGNSMLIAYKGTVVLYRRIRFRMQLPAVPADLQ